MFARVGARDGKGCVEMYVLGELEFEEMCLLVHGCGTVQGCVRLRDKSQEFEGVCSSFWVRERDFWLVKF